MSKIKNIDFLRIIAILSIILLHFFHSRQGGILSLGIPIHSYDKLAKWTQNGQKAVDFFFILSGLFFYLGFVAHPSQKFSDFIVKKIIRLWPVMAFTVLLAGIFALFGLIKFTYWDNIYALLFLNGTTLYKMSGNLGISWYCSAIMVQFILFFYLLKNFNSKTVWLIITLGVYVSYTIILQGNNFHINNAPHLYLGFFNSFLLRAWGGMGLGMLIALFYHNNENRIKNYSPIKSIKILITAGEFICLYFMINNLMLHRFSHTNDFMFILVFVAIITAFICNKGYISQFLNLDIFPYLSKYIYSIFMTHTLLFSALKSGFWAKHPQFIIEHPFINLSITVSLAIVLGVLVYHLIEIKCKTYLTQKYCK